MDKANSGRPQVKQPCGNQAGNCSVAHAAPAVVATATPRPARPPATEHQAAKERAASEIAEATGREARQ